mmetsp:Transcript_72764/g.224763  ORF Transcript_72764/g.224763 Transcript_72764/m.224763 type:complete len:458 (-) Transcript_72764:751-2124(-)
MPNDTLATHASGGCPQPPQSGTFGSARPSVDCGASLPELHKVPPSLRAEAPSGGIAGSGAPARVRGCHRGWNGCRGSPPWPGSAHLHPTFAIKPEAARACGQAERRIDCWPWTARGAWSCPALPPTSPGCWASGSRVRGFGRVDAQRRDCALGAGELIGDPLGDLRQLLVRGQHAHRRRHPRDAELGRLPRWCRGPHGPACRVSPRRSPQGLLEIQWRDEVVDCLDPVAEGLVQVLAIVAVNPPLVRKLGERLALLRHQHLQCQVVLRVPIPPRLGVGQELDVALCLLHDRRQALGEVRKALHGRVLAEHGLVDLHEGPQGLDLHERLVVVPPAEDAPRPREAVEDGARGAASLDVEVLHNDGLKDPEVAPGGRCALLDRLRAEPRRGVAAELPQPAKVLCPGAVDLPLRAVHRALHGLHEPGEGLAADETVVVQLVVLMYDHVEDDVEKLSQGLLI